MTYTEIIAEANVGEEVDVSAHTVYASVKFWYHPSFGYSYDLKSKGARNRKISPLMSNGWDMKFWKRLDSAKRHFLKMHPARN